MSTAQPKLDDIKKALLDQGFVETERNIFSGTLDCEEYGPIAVVLNLPLDFPQKPPKIFVPGPLPYPIPHREPDGKLCLFRESSFLLDASRPIAILNQTIDRARNNVLLSGLRKENLADFIDEFVAYWITDEHAWSICNPFGVTRTVVQARIDGNALSKYSIFVDSADAIEGWCTKLGHELIDLTEAFFVEVEKPFYPPDFCEQVSNRTLYGYLRDNCAKEVIAAFDKWLYHRDLPRVVLLSMPSRAAGQRTLIAARIQRASGEALVKAQAGFRPGARVQGAREFHVSMNNPTDKIQVDRLDKDFTVPRGGGSISLSEKRVVIIGCGAIGSRLSEQLASSGVGTIRLVDKEDFHVENIYRHMLGIEDIGSKKAERMCALLDKRFPQQTHEFRAEDIEKVLADEPEFVLNVDIIVFAIGDDNLELIINDNLSKNVPRLHVWVEPLGLGGHVLQKTAPNAGCFRCIFRKDDEHGLVDLSSFVAAGQNLQQSHSGCAGVFTPFSALDADRAANEAARRTVDFLTGKSTENALVSWLSRKSAFVETDNLQLSKRGEMFAEDEHHVELEFADSECGYCYK